ncbi:rod shape-determining protein [Streptomyces sp. NBC_00122]|uniref:rod shape-determining protein n=1 Tax=Streptomyces sp. NBC_00122 TaxID=2903623 RepID=UPI003248E53D
MPQASTNKTASSRDIGMDLGTANTLVYARGHGIVLNEPSVVAVKAGTTTALAVIGGGTSEVAVISLGGIVTSRSLRVGGDRLDAAIMDYVRKEHSLLIGERTAEDVKVGIGSAWPVPDRPELETLAFTVRGREKVGGMPKTLSLAATEVRAALDEPVEAIIAAVRTTLEECPPELSGDVMEHGIVLTGGGALLPGLDLRMTSATGIPVFVADSPLDCVALGSGRCVEDLDTPGALPAPAKA